MTCFALGAQPAGMRVFAAVTAGTLARKLGVQIAAAMATGAVDARMRAEERESGLPGVVEFRGLPAVGRVAVAALGAAFPAVHVIRRMAGDTKLRRALVSIAEMAGETRDILMLVAQWKGGLVVVEPDLAPIVADVTAGAVIAELAVVRFLLLVAGNAFGLRVPESLATHMAAFAG